MKRAAAIAVLVLFALAFLLAAPVAYWARTGDWVIFPFALGLIGLIVLVVWAMSVVFDA